MIKDDVGHVIEVLVDVPALGLDDGLDPGPELSANCLDKVLAHLGPLLGDGNLQRVDVGVLLGTGPCLNIRPYGKVQRIEIRRAGWPNLLRPVRDVLKKPLLNCLCSVTWSTVLHEDDVIVVGEVTLDPRFDMGDQDAVQVLFSPHPEAGLEKDWWHLFAV